MTRNTKEMYWIKRVKMKEKRAFPALVDWKKWMVFSVPVLLTITWMKGKNVLQHNSFHIRKITMFSRINDVYKSCEIASSLSFYLVWNFWVKNYSTIQVCRHFVLRNVFIRNLSNATFWCMTFWYFHNFMHRCFDRTFLS